MKYFLALTFAAVAFAATIKGPDFRPSPITEDSEIEVIYENEDGTQESKLTILHFLIWCISNPIT